MAVGGEVNGRPTGCDPETGPVVLLAAPPYVGADQPIKNLRPCPGHSSGGAQTQGGEDVMVRIPGFVKSRRAAAAGLACGLALLAGCESSPSAQEDDRDAFLVEVVGEQFYVRATNPEAVAALRARQQSGEVSVVLGEVKQGDGGFNAPWSWHLDPATVEVADAAMELCDGRPSMVQQNVGKWIAEARVYCPWSAKVVKAPK